jgi:hypothetical protein
MGCVEENNQYTNRALSHSDLKFYSREVPVFCEPLNSCLPSATEDTGCSGTVTPDWVFVESGWVLSSCVAIL